jgi:FlaA1/EpsC-like NDP-sugar epimerase
MRLYVLLGVDVGLILLATSLGFVLRENFEITQGRFEAFLPYLCATSVMSVVFVSAAGLNRSIWRFSSVHDYLRVGIVVTAVSIGAVALSFAYNRLEGIARSLPFLQIIVGIMVLVAARVIHRLRHAARQRKKDIRIPTAGRRKSAATQCLGCWCRPADGSIYPSFG